MKPKQVIAWAMTLTAILLLGCIVVCGVRAMFQPNFSLAGVVMSVLTPGVTQALLVLLIAVFIASIVVHLSKVTGGEFQFSGLGFTFKGFACQATLWVLVFMSVTVGFTILSESMAPSTLGANRIVYTKNIAQN